MKNEAHGLRLEHPLFHAPLEAHVVLEPNDWERDFDDRGVWRVQTGELGKEVDYGVVSDGYGFEDSPDCERISGGINSKGPMAVAIGRQANLLQWGFYAAPDRMTPSAQRAFLNAIVYIHGFDGARPLVQKRSRSREWVGPLLDHLRTLDERPEDSRASLRAYLARQFPAPALEACGLNADALADWFAGHLEALRRGDGDALVLDEDLQTLALSNRRPELLDFLSARLAADPRDPLATRLAKRYLDLAGRAPADAGAWIRENRPWLFFSDAGGFRWFVDVQAKARASADSSAAPPKREPSEPQRP